MRTSACDAEAVVQNPRAVVATLRAAEQDGLAFLVEVSAVLQDVWVDLQNVQAVVAGEPGCAERASEAEPAQVVCPLVPAPPCI